MPRPGTPLPQRCGRGAALLLRLRAGLTARHAPRRGREPDAESCLRRHGCPRALPHSSLPGSRSTLPGLLLVAWEPWLKCWASPALLRAHGVPREASPHDLRGDLSAQRHHRHTRRHGATGVSHALRSLAGSSLPTCSVGPQGGLSCPRHCRMYALVVESGGAWHTR
jgi:hypothetical protein